MGRLRNKNGNDRVTVPGHLLSPRGGEHYVLRVVGDNMIDEAIRDGDFVIVARREGIEQISPGEMCVVLVGDDATIKRVYPEGPMTMLRSANLQSIHVPTKDVKVQGVVVGLMRKF